jgi:hypothetical protein
VGCGRYPGALTTDLIELLLNGVKLAEESGTETMKKAGTSVHAQNLQDVPGGA